MCAMETVQSFETFSVNSTAPGSSAATSAMRIRPSEASYSLRNASRSGSHRYAPFCAPFFFSEKNGPSI